MSNPYYSRGNIRYFLVPLAVALAGFLIFVAAVPWTFQEFVPAPGDLLDDVRMEGKVALARHFMGASFLIFLCACAAAFSLSWRVVRENVPRGEMPFFLGMYVVALVVLGGAISLVSGAPLYVRLGEGMGGGGAGSRWRATSWARAS